MLIFHGEWKIKSRRVNDGKSRGKKAFFIGGDALAVAIDSESAFLRSFLLPLISSFYSFSASALRSLRKPAFTLKPVHSPCLSSSTSFPFFDCLIVKSFICSFVRDSLVQSSFHYRIQ